MNSITSFYRKLKRIFVKKKTHTIHTNVDNKNRIPIHLLAKKSLDRHSKPTLPYGSIKVIGNETFEDLNYLSGKKEDQEREVMEKFITLLNRSSNSQLGNLKQLAEDDNDFILNEKDKKIEVQLTEMSFREIGYKAGDLFYIPDANNTINLLKNYIKLKIDKCYSKPRDKKFWLVVYQLDLPAYEKEIITTAREYLKTVKNPFDAIWYFYLYSPEPQGTLIQIHPVEPLYNFKM